MQKITISELIILNEDFELYDTVETHADALALLFNIATPHELIYIKIDDGDYMSLVEYLIRYHPDQLYWRLATVIDASSSFNIRDIYNRMQNLLGNKRTVIPKDHDLVLLVVWEGGGIMDEVPLDYDFVKMLYTTTAGR